MKKYRVDYQAGTSRYGNKGVDYMLVSVPAPGMEDIGLEAELYAEEDIVPGNEDANYEALKAEILRLAEEANIDPECLEFFHD